MSLISVIVPVYKVEAYLERCINSILNQTFQDYELILIDDGSPDNCGEICDKYAECDKRIHVIHQENAGLSAARNAGIDWAFEHSNSEWLTFIDSDDWIHPCYLEYLIEVVMKEDTHVGICSFLKSNCYNDYPNYKECSYKTYSPETYYRYNPASATVAWGKIYYKENFSQIRYPNGRLHEDVYITHKLLFKEKKIAVVDSCLYYYFANPEGITNTSSIKKTKDALEGTRIRAKYFYDNGYMSAYEYEINTPVYISLELQAMNSGIVKKDIVYKNKLIKKLRKIIKERKIPFGGNEWVYELAYSKLVKMYWIGVAIFRRVRRKVNISYK